MSKLTERIDQVLAKRGISKAEFYKACNITSSAYSLWNKEKASPRFSNIKVIANYLEVRPEWLMTGEGQEKAPSRTAEREIIDDDFTYAMHNETKDLPQDKKDMLLSMARFFREELEKEKRG